MPGVANTANNILVDFNAESQRALNSLWKQRVLGIEDESKVVPQLCSPPTQSGYSHLCQANVKS
jgi:hypothetical protein